MSDNPEMLQAVITVIVLALLFGLVLILESFTRSSIPLAVAALILVLLAGGVFYVGIYDTAAARCSRGDLGSCLVVSPAP